MNQLMITKWKIGILAILLAALITGCSLADAMQAIPWLNPTITSTPTVSSTPTSTRTLLTFDRWTSTPTNDGSISSENGSAENARATITPIPTQTLRPSWTPLPSNTLRPTWTLSPTLTPSITLTPTATPEIARFVYETFSDPEAAWLQTSGGNWAVWIEPKKLLYAMEISQGNVEITSSRSWLQLAEVGLEADIAVSEGEGYYGFNCRESSSNYYTLFITSDGHYGLGKTTNGHVEFLLYAPSIMVKSAPGEYNRVRAECRGNTITLWVNGALLAREEVEGLGAGYAGMMVGTRYDQKYVVAHFDNLQVWGPSDFSISTLTPSPTVEE